MKNIIYYTKTTGEEQLNNKSLCDIKLTTLTPFKITAPNEQISLKAGLFRLIISIIVWKRITIVSGHIGSDCVHTSIVIPKCVKFPFLKEHEYEIGPCFTVPKARGRGIYPYILNWITANYDLDPNAKYFMFVYENNKSSIKGIEKAGFKIGGKATVNKLKQYNIY